MRPAEDIQTLFEQSHITPDLERQDRILGDALVEMERRGSTTGSRIRPLLWKSIMKNRVFQLSSAAAVVMLTVAIGLINLVSTKRVYGIEDIPELLYSAKTLHMEATVYFPGNNVNQSAEVNSWLDMEKDRWRQKMFSLTSAENGFDITPREEIFDGSDTVARINHKEKTITFKKLSPLQIRLYAPQRVKDMVELLCGQHAMFDQFKNIDRETLNGRTYQIWEGIVDAGAAEAKIRTWLSGQTGHVAKAKVWKKGSEGDWQTFMDIHSVEKDIVLSNSLFEVQEMVGYTYTNTRETAPEEMAPGLSSGGFQQGAYRLETHLLFALPDGSLILCWSSYNTQVQESQESLFADLSLGSELPKLPFEIDSLTGHWRGQEITYTGCHLAYTQKDGRIYEWTLYVPDKRPAGYDSPWRELQVNYRSHTEVQESPWLKIYISAVINDDNDFRGLVIEAFKAFSDSHSVPELTYEDMMQLSTSKRK